MTTADYFKFQTEDFACIGTVDIWRNIPIIEIHFTDRDFVPSKYIFSTPKQLKKLSRFLTKTANRVEKENLNE
jgi:hypothetical protein